MMVVLLLYSVAGGVHSKKVHKCPLLRVNSDEGGVLGLFVYIVQHEVDNQENCNYEMLLFVYYKIQWSHQNTTISHFGQFRMFLQPDTISLATQVL